MGIPSPPVRSRETEPPRGVPVPEALGLLHWDSRSRVGCGNGAELLPQGHPTLHNCRGRHVHPWDPVTFSTRRTSPTGDRPRPFVHWRLCKGPEDEPRRERGRWGTRRGWEPTLAAAPSLGEHRFSLLLQQVAWLCP